MKIADIRVFAAANDLAGKLWNPKIRWTVKHSLLLEVETDEGAVGVGECWCFDRRPDALAAFIAHEVSPRVLGLDALDPAAVAALLNDTTTLSARHGIMASALSGLDIALWDIAARARGWPLWRLLAGAEAAAAPAVPAHQVAVYASGGLYGQDKSPEALGAELAGYVAEGFDCVKMKVGALPPGEDEARVRAARAALDAAPRPTGAGAPRLIVDGVYSFDAAGAAAFWDRIADCGAVAFQSPLPAEDLDGMAALVARGIPVMGLEAEYRPAAVRALLDRAAVAILQFAPVACGGLSAGLRFAGLARAAGRPCSLEVSSTAVAQLAAFHLAAADAAIESVEIHKVHQVLFDLIGEPLGTLRAGRLTLSDRPGLGIELPSDRLERLG